MPTYEYRCKSCGHELEVQQAFSDAPLSTCPECEGDLRKVYGNVGISFKGSGFYKNDARPSKGTKSGSGASDKPSADKPSADKPSSGDSSASGDAKTSTAAASSSTSSSE